MHRAIALALTLIVLPGTAAAQGPRAADRPHLTAVRATPPPVVDGAIDEPLWRTAAHIDTFVQQKPAEGAPASEKTDVWVAYDKDRIYVAVHAHYADRALMRANRLDRDQTANDDLVTVFFDPFLDQQRGYAFSVNGYGVQADAILQGASVAGGQASTGDSTWNALYQSAGRLVDDGWTAEMAIPIKSLRYPSRRPGEPHQWGFQVLREIRGRDETVTWAPVSTKVLGFLPQMGVLEGLDNLSTRRNIEVMPTVTAVQVGRLDTTSGAFRDTGVREAGVNLKYGITPNLTIDATFNPDFSQIESDQPQIEVNQRFPLLFAELRPFFLEGQEVFQVPGPVGTLVHTRTILDPQYGLKLSGKQGRTIVGVLVANDEAPGKVDDRQSPFYRQHAQVVVGRVKYDVYRQSYLGAMVTDRELVDRFSRVALVDGGFQLGRSARSGFQIVRSDRIDAAGVRRAGTVFNADFRKEGRNLTYFAAHNDIPPDFGSDLAFIRRVDQHQTVGSVNYRWWPGGKVVNWGPGVRYDVYYDYAGTKTDDKKQATVAATFTRNNTLSLQIDRNMERYRGFDFDKTRYTVAGTFYSNRRILVKADVNFGDEIRFITTPYLGRATGVNATITLRPSSRLQSLVTLNTTHFTDVRVWRTDFDVKIVRALTTYQFTERLLVRNILEGNTLNRTLGLNLLGTYRVNAGTVFFLGYDDRYREGVALAPSLFDTAAYQRTNRAVFAKLQYLFRY